MEKKKRCPDRYNTTLMLQSELDSTKGDRPQLHVDSFAIVAYFSMCNWGLSPFVLLLGTVVVAVVVLFLLFLFVKA